MKSTISDNRQLFNAKTIAYGKTPDQLANGEFGIYDVNGNTSIATSVDTFAELPAKFRIISKYNDKVNYSLEDIDKTKIFNKTFKTYNPETVNVWQGLFTSCDCTKSVYLNIHVNEDALMRRDGMTWTHRDYVFEITPQELSCLCDCNGKAVYDNNVITKALFDKIKANNSPYYTAEVWTINDGGAKIDNLATSAAIKAVIDANKAVNTDSDLTNEGPRFVLVIKGLPQTRKVYRDLEPSYVYPRGVVLNPAGLINDNVPVKFIETQDIRYENGAGYDMRHEEWENMSNYSEINHYTQLSDGLAAPELIYQFENNKNYDVLTFEYDSPKTERAGSADMKRMMIIIGAETGSLASTTINGLFS